MVKPVSELYRSIMEFALRAPQIQNLLKQRDSHADAYMSEIGIRFFKANENDKNSSAYSVNFIYNTHYPNQEKNDDIKCYVEVTSGNPVKFNIIKVILE